MSELKVEFKYEIGDLVYFRSALHNDSNCPKAFIITERIVQQCYGGTQLLYRISGIEGTHPEIVFQYGEPEYQPRSPEYTNEQIAIKTVMRDFERRQWDKVKSGAPITKSATGEKS
jgi:hypothetical protein